MNFFHGTCEDSAIDIFRCGTINHINNYESDTTKLINQSLLNYIGENIREDAIYMWQKIEDTSGADYTFEISIDMLDTNKLYVGDYEAVNDLYIHVDYELLHMYAEENIAIATDFSKQYKKSFIPYTEYIKDKQSYENKYTPEFLYFGDIKIKRDDEFIDYVNSHYDLSI